MSAESEKIFGSIVNSLSKMPNITYLASVLEKIESDAKVMTGTNGIVDGTLGFVPAPTKSDLNKFLRSDGKWVAVSGGSGSGSSSSISETIVENVQNVNATAYLSASTSSDGITSSYFKFPDVSIKKFTDNHDYFLTFNVGDNNSIGKIGLRNNSPFFGYITAPKDMTHSINYELPDSTKASVSLMIKENLTNDIASNASTFDNDISFKSKLKVENNLNNGTELSLIQKSFSNINRRISYTIRDDKYGDFYILRSDVGGSWQNQDEIDIAATGKQIRPFVIKSEDAKCYINGVTTYDDGSDGIPVITNGTLKLPPVLNTESVKIETYINSNNESEIKFSSPDGDNLAILNGIFSGELHGTATKALNTDSATRATYDATGKTLVGNTGSPSYTAVTSITDKIAVLQRNTTNTYATRVRYGVDSTSKTDVIAVRSPMAHEGINTSGVSENIDIPRNGWYYRPIYLYNSSSDLASSNPVNAAQYVSGVICIKY